MEKLNELSVFLPIYNEERNITATANRVLEVLPKVAQTFELLLVDDGSHDKTPAVLSGLAAANPAIRVLSHGTNKGYGMALRSGLYGAKYEWVAFLDSDGQFDFGEVTLFIEKQRQTGADLVIGYYLRRAVPFYRKLNSFLWQAVVFLIFGLAVRDIDCGFKLIRRRVVERIAPLESERGAFISTELLVKAKKAGFKIVELGVHHYPRLGGKGTGASLKVILKSFSDLLRLREKL